MFWRILGIRLLVLKRWYHNVPYSQKPQHKKNVLRFSSQINYQFFKHTFQKSKKLSWKDCNNQRQRRKSRIKPKEILEELKGKFERKKTFATISKKNSKTISKKIFGHSKYFFFVHMQSTRFLTYVTTIKSHIFYVFVIRSLMKAIVDGM